MSVVLGYDESPGAERALEAAITIALRFGEPLILVYGVAPPGAEGEEFRSHQQALEELGRTAATPLRVPARRVSKPRSRS